MGVSAASKKVTERYFHLLTALGNELFILREAPLADVREAGGWALEEGIRRLRAGKVIRKSGYDGEYGVISLFAPGELEMLGGQMAMFDMSALPAKAKRTAPIPGKPLCRFRKRPRPPRGG